MVCNQAPVVSSRAPVVSPRAPVVSLPTPVVSERTPVERTRGRQHLHEIERCSRHLRLPGRQSISGTETSSTQSATRNSARNDLKTSGKTGDGVPGGPAAESLSGWEQPHARRRMNVMDVAASAVRPCPKLQDRFRVPASEAEFPLNESLVGFRFRRTLSGMSSRVADAARGHDVEFVIFSSVHSSA